MAIWQLKSELIPSERIGARTRLGRSEFDDDAWWADRQPPGSYREQLSTLLPLTKSWHENLLWFGQDSGDRIDVWVEDDERVRSVGVRIDCSRLNAPFVRNLAQLSREWSCVLVELRYFTVLPPDASDLLRAVADSPSRKLLDNPEIWLPKLAAEVNAAKRGG